MPKKQLIVYLIILVVVFCLGIVIGKAGVPSPAEIKKATLSQIDNQFNEKAKKGLFLFPFSPGMQRKINSLSGEVMEIDKSDKTLKVKVTNYYQGGSITEYLASQHFQIIKVRTGESTQITKMVLPEKPEEITEIKETSASFDEIEKGKSVSVETEELFDISEVEEVLAKKIRL